VGAAGILPTHASVPGLGGERLVVRYRIGGDAAEARERAADVCLEQTVEFPADLLPAGDIPDHLVGRLERLEAAGPHAFEATISYAVEVAGGELPQLLNLLFGNSSIKPSVRLHRIEPAPGAFAGYRGPRFGQEGLRALLGVPHRPLLMTALKPLGLDVRALAELAYRYARSGIDMVKDDHGLANQPIAPFGARLDACAAAVARANAETGGRSVYVPNVSGPADAVHARARAAKEAGAGAVLVCPGLVGFDAMRALADDDALALPVISHPAFHGGFVTSPGQGISHHVLYGSLQRLAGADASIFPNVGGRFAFSADECREIAAGCNEPFGDLRPAFATPGGGMQLETVPRMRDLYGDQVIYLVGGGLHRGRLEFDATVAGLLRAIATDR
jgi:ribulose-bisphosphate carboxylase large chain